ncbi:GSCOCT00005213001.2-RA-CDS [Cotesia congregata]|uniref:Venom protein 80-4 n=1 Tax=Cotesia congregata TaxID=51543 RepID=A0A8J2MQL6_COTCN|nr:GSCOCT00005213001.2-RA-CDS [Cotesia congregata]CAG5101884.1 Venom protein 80-4 [Cotesia congregata]
MKFFAVILMTTLVCFIHASKVDESCSSHKECGQMDLGCFDGKCQWIQNYLSNKDVSGSYHAKNLGDPCTTYQHCSRVPTDADNEIICYSMACISRKKRE